MNKIFYSAASNGFYDSAIHGTSIPVGAVEITKEQHRDLIDGQSTGKLISIDDDGHPLLLDQPPLSLDAQRDRTADAIRSDFQVAAEQSVAANGTTWNGGMNSALAIDGAVRLAEQMGQTSIALFDFDNAEHVVSIEAGKQIAAAVGVDYQAKLARKQQLLRDIATADKDQLKSISW